ncbi:N-6 DNA methylase [Methylomonas sp. ZR1]|uniref:Eco57I restriction-modification methylase domain-containing protein n=1 Tax=Methylomonas sp. ZR1 TaxID=1797072 RepID=UPI001491CD44|nr:N-6 DNA methylase [Methylomonas sp. ZR1]NOV29249.1 SAM-dependent DNA methyltransferase [Methylomonas sp. ZR1]
MKRVRKNHSTILNLPTLRLEGGLFLPDQLEKAARGQASQQSEADYRIPAGLKLKDEYSRAFQIASAQWKQFAPNLERKDIDPAQVTVKFVGDLLRDALAYQPIDLVSGLTVGERQYPITTLAGNNIPVVIAPHTLGLDEPDPRFAIIGSGARKKSAFQLAQEFINASTDHLWAIVTNGKQCRLLRDANTLTRPSFLEFDLQDMLDGQNFAEFEMAWRILHASRAGIHAECIWEAWRGEGQREGTRVRDGLRQGVTDALLQLGNGFIQHPANEKLRLDLHEGRLSKDDYFQQLLRLVYRFIFLFTVEERGVLHTDDETPAAIAARKAYAEGYALARLRTRCLRRHARNPFDDQWQSLRIVFRSLAHGEPRLALPALGGLFAVSQCTDLDTASLSNASLLDAVKQLRWSNVSGNLAPVDYRNMGTEELGSVYESLLELVAEIDIPARQFGFVGLTSEGSTQGNARKTTGSYYTPDSLVQELIKSALDPIIEDRLANNPDNPTEALLSIKVIDPACGSGHFLLAAARRLAERLAALRAPEGAVRPQDYRHALREVISKCIFGVDRNPMAIELARTALWLEGFEEGLALSFLDHHLICGDALIGLTDLKQLQSGIPDAAFKPLSGDDKAVCKDIAKANKEALKAFSKLKNNQNLDIAIDDAAGLSELEALENLPDSTPAQAAIKEAAYREFLQHAKEHKLGHAADLLIGAFLTPKSDEQAKISTPTSQNLYLELYTDQSAGDLHGVYQTERLATARQLCAEARVLHWPLIFPQVFAKGGFDCVLGNPPWERIKLQEEEFFATRNRYVAEAKNKAERSQRIDWLAQGILAQQLYPELQQALHECEAERRLYQEFINARRTAEAASIFAHVKGDDGGRYPLTGVGDVNTYALFAETITQITSEKGRAGFIVPTGIATDDSTKAFFSRMIETGRLFELLAFENEEFIFPAVHHSFRFCLLVIAGQNQIETANFAFFARQPSQIHDERRRFQLSRSDFANINPNTLTCPVFRSRMDAELTRKIYQRVPVLIREARGKRSELNPWGIRFMTMFHMSGDSHLFADTLDDNKLPLYEAKMIHQFDHRWASYRVEDGMDVSGDVSLAEKQDPDFSVMPRYWVDKAEVDLRLRDKGWGCNWLMGWRNIARSTDERTFISSVMPKYAVGHSMPLWLLSESPNKATAFLANMTALVFDYVVRQKLGGTNMTFGYYKQIPAIPPDFYTETDLNFIVPRVLELTYTAHDLQSWAKDLGYDGSPFTFDPERRAGLRAELDAWYAKAYGMTRDELRYILDPADIMGDDYPSETFRVLKNNELKQFGEYRTQRLVLAVFDRMAEAEAKGIVYQSPLLPLPGQHLADSYSPQGIIRDRTDATLAGLLLAMIREKESVLQRQLDLAMLMTSRRSMIDQFAVPAQNLLTRLHESGVFESERLERIHPLLGYFEEIGAIKMDRNGLISLQSNSAPEGVIIETDTPLLAQTLLKAADEKLNRPDASILGDDRSSAKFG